jgi:hypothetical protein
MEEQYNDLLEEQEKELQRIDEEARVLFQSLGVDEVEILKVLRDKSRFTPEEWASLQRKREALEKAIDARIQASKLTAKPTQAKSADIQGHWLFVR